MILMHRQAVIGIRRGLEFPFMPRLNAPLSHKPCNPILPAPNTSTSKLRMNTGAAVSFSALFVDGLYMSDKP